MLHVVHPSERMGHLFLLGVLHCSEVLGYSEMSNDIARRDVHSNQEHSGFHMLIQMVSELLSGSPGGQLDEVLDLSSFLGVLLAE